MSIKSRKMLRQALLAEGINIEALKLAIEMDINTLIGSIEVYQMQRKANKEPYDQMEWIEKKSLEAYWLLFKALE